MVSKEISPVNVYRLHFTDSDENDHYENIQAKNDFAMMYFAKKIMKANTWELEDFWNLMIFHYFLWISKYVVIWSQRDCDGKIIMRTYLVSSIIKPFEQILQLPANS